MDQKYIIGVDGGGTKTTVALAKTTGEVVKIAVGPASNPRNVGLEECVRVIKKLVEEVKGEEKIGASFIALAAVEEEYSDSKNYIAQSLKEVLQSKVEVGSDQLAAFRCGTKENYGAVIIAGTGAVSHGWNEGKEAKNSGWGYLADEGSAFYVGIEGFRSVSKHLDKRGKQTLITDILLKKWDITSDNQLRKIVYSDFKKFIPQISVFVDEAGKLGDKVAVNILQNAGEELVLSLKKTITDVELEGSFPVILSGAMFRSKIVFNYIKNSVLSDYKEAQVMLNDKDPVNGSVALAIELCSE